MAENVNIVFIKNDNTIYTNVANELPHIAVAAPRDGAAVLVAMRAVGGGPAAPFSNLINSIDANLFLVLLNYNIGGTDVHLALWRVNNTQNFFNDANYTAKAVPVSALPPGGGARFNIPNANITECLAEPFLAGGRIGINVNPDVAAPAPAAESPRRIRKEKYMLVDSWWPFGWPFGPYGPFRMPPLISQDSLRIPVKSTMPQVPPSVPRTGAPVAPTAPRAPGPNAAPKSPRAPGANSSPKTRTSPRKQSPNGSTRGRSPRTGSPRARSPRARSPRARSPGRISPGRISPGRMSRGRRGGDYEKYLKYKAKYLALKKELGL